MLWKQGEDRFSPRELTHRGPLSSAALLVFCRSGWWLTDPASARAGMHRRSASSPSLPACYLHALFTSHHLGAPEGSLPTSFSDHQVAKPCLVHNSKWSVHFRDLFYLPPGRAVHSWGPEQ